MCGLSREIYEEPYWMKTAIIGSATVIVIGVVTAVVVPIVLHQRKKKKMKELTW